MDLAGGAIGEAALAGTVLLASGAEGGSAYNESLNETTAAGDALSPRSVLGPTILELFGIADSVLTQAVMTSSLAEGAALGDMPSAPGGTVSDFVSDTISLADVYAASGLWVGVAQTATGWQATLPAAAIWTVAPAPSEPWLKH
jgi:hypothetical protein